MSEAYRARSRNVLLTKDDIGRAKHSVYDLPEADFAFGAGQIPDLEGAREVTMHWASHQPRSKQGSATQDFRKINKNAAKSGVANASQLAQYRREGGDIMLMGSGPVGQMPKVIPSDVIPSFSYGRKSRPSTPIAAVIGNMYGQESEEIANATYAQHEAMSDMPNGKTRIKLTKAAQSRIHDARQRNRDPPPPKEPFIMSKFKKVGPKLVLPGGVKKSSSLPNLPSASMQYMEPDYTA